MPTSHLKIPGVDVTAIDAVARAAYAIWQYNGHDVPGAVLHVHRNHVDQAVRAAAGEAYDQLLITPIIWRAFEIEFQRQAVAER